MCSYTDLIDGTLTMEDVWIMNDFLDFTDYAEATLNEKAMKDAGL